LLKNYKVSKGTLFLIPTFLGDTLVNEVLPDKVVKTVEKLNYFIVENEKTARRYIKKICPNKNQSDFVIFQLDKHNPSSHLQEFIQPLLNHHDVGLLSEAGLPAVADPGNLIVHLAHQKNISVKPLTGPSSLMLALMASGLNGQKFSFEGYLPKDASKLKHQIKFLEKRSLKEDKAIICIETPYRNQKLFDFFLNNLQSETLLTVATDLTLPTEFIKTLPIKIWKNYSPDLHKRPSVFIFQAR